MAEMATVDGRKSTKQISVKTENKADGCKAGATNSSSSSRKTIARERLQKKGRAWYPYRMRRTEPNQFAPKRSIQLS